VAAEKEPEDPDILDETLRGALFRMSGEEELEAAEQLDIVDLAGGARSDALAPDLTLGGYIELHNRVPAFEGIDGQPYTVDVDLEAAADGGYAAFLIFVRWAATGAGIMDHVESRDVAMGATEEDARRAALELSLYEVKAELDAAIQRKNQDLEE
jgi:hypothetical protein